MKRLGIGLIGYGGIGRVHALAYRSIPLQYGLPADAVQIVGVATGRGSAAEAAARELGCSIWTADYRQLLESDEIDIIDICVPNHLHEEIIIAAAHAGKHILCEKPLAMDASQGERIVATVEKSGVNNQINFNFRFYPAVTRARQLVEAGFLGRVFSFRGCYYRSSYISSDKPLSWRLSQEVSGGGALFDLGSHLIDLIHYLLGDVASVFASLDTLIKERPVRLGSPEMGRVDVDDIALMQVKMEDGALGSLEISRMGTGATNDLKIEIFGEHGALRFNSAEPSWLEVFDARDPAQPTGGMSGFRKLQAVGRFEGQKAPDWSMAPGFTATFVESQHRFIQAVLEDRPASPSLADGQHTQIVMEAAMHSSHQASWVEIKPNSKGF